MLHKDGISRRDAILFYSGIDFPRSGHAVTIVRQVLKGFLLPHPFC